MKGIVESFFEFDGDKIDRLWQIVAPGEIVNSFYTR
jgi:hypothetical protein